MITPIHIPQKKRNGAAKTNSDIFQQSIPPTYPLAAFFGRLDTLLEQLMVEESKEGKGLTIINAKADPHHNQKVKKP